MPSRRKRVQRAKQSLFKPLGKGEAFYWIAGAKVYKERFTDYEPRQVLYDGVGDELNSKNTRLTPVFIQHNQLMKKNRDLAGRISHPRK